MKKRFLTITGLVIALIGVTGYGFFCSALNTSLTDTVSVTIESNCTLEYDSENPHNSGTKKGTWSENALSVTMENSSVDTNIGKTNFKAICNYAGGFNVNLDTTPLQDSSTNDVIPFKNSEPTSSDSSWGVYNGSSWVTDGGIVTTGSGSTSGATFSATYGVGIDSTQSAGTYEASATYTLTHPAVAATEYYTLTFGMNNDNAAENAVLSTTSYKVPKGSKIVFGEDNSISIDGGNVMVVPTTFGSYYAMAWDIGGTYYSGRNGSSYTSTYTVNSDTTLNLVVDTACIAKGSKITMADGTEKNVEDVQMGDYVLAYSAQTGTLISSRVHTVWADKSVADIFTVRLENGNSIKIVTNEYVFDTDSKEWLLIDYDSYQSAVGTNIMVNNNGEIGISKIVGIDYEHGEIEHYTLYTDVTLDYIANNIMMMFPFYFTNLRYTIGDDFKIDMDKYNADVAQYGTYTYDDFEDVCTKATFDSLSLKDATLIVAKGYVTFEEFAEGVRDMQAEIDYYNSL